MKIMLGVFYFYFLFNQNKDPWHAEYMYRCMHEPWQLLSAVNYDSYFLLSRHVHVWQTRQCLQQVQARRKTRE